MTHSTRVAITAIAVVAFLGASNVSAKKKPRPPGPPPPPVPTGVLSLAVDDETAPPSGTVQVKLRVTDPTPISTGFADFFDFSDGIALGTSDAAAVGISRSGRLRLRFVFPTDPMPALIDEYPLVTIKGPVPPGLTDGQVFPLVIDPGTLVVTNTGVPYQFELRQGELSISSAALSIDRIEPGSAQVNAGDTVHIYGRNFTPDTEVDLNETAVREVRFISHQHLEVAVAEPALMHRKRIRLRNRGAPPTRSRVTYYSYQVTRATSPSLDPLLSLAHPVFPLQGGVQTTVVLPPTPNPVVYGLALQNVGSAPVSAQLALASAGGSPLGTATIVVGSNERVVRGTSELFGQACNGGCTFTVSATAPVQVIGIAGDPSTDSAVPILAR